jgi:peptidoglycan/LPS O-acetylase OafA/YrhL
MAILTNIAEIYEVSDERHRLLSMEGLRGFAVILVFFVHFDALYSGYAIADPILHDVFTFLGNVGNAGVDLFFVLSGYLIYGALIRRKTSYLKFIRRRIERIYPTFLVVFGVYLILSVVFRSENKIHGAFLPASLYIIENALLLPGIFRITPIITVAWSLSYEFFFYLSIPLIVWVTRMRNWNRAARVLFFAVLWIAYIFYAFTVPQSQVRLLMFVAGIQFYELMDSGWLKGKLTQKGEILAILLFLASLAFIYLYDARPGSMSFLPGFKAGRTVLPGVPTFQGPYKVMALSFTCPLLAFYCFQFDGLLNRMFSWDPMRYLGNMSYSYYLIHGLALHTVALLAYRIAPQNVPNLTVFMLALPLGFIATWIASTILFARVEKPISLRRPTAANSPVKLARGMQ